MRTEPPEVTVAQLDTRTVVRVMKRLNAAVGYHELGMPQHALQCLTSLWELGDIGPFRTAQRILRTAVLEGREDPGALAKALEEAADRLPPPQKHALWRALGGCYRPTVDMPRAITRRGSRRGA